MRSLDRPPRSKARSPIPLALRLCGLLATLALAGCQPNVLDPQGQVGRGDATILIDSVAIMLAIVVPTGVVALTFAWWFRASNTRAIHLPEFEYSGQVEMITWSIPLLTIMLLGGVAWIGSHELDPAQPLAAEAAPIDVQVVSLDWKWLFIYPAQRVASVNRLVIPAGVPVHFTLTSASVMNAFFIPDLGSMIYTMNRMATDLNLIADKPGEFLGESAMFSGDGFADMHFNVEAVPPDQFKAWVEETRSSGGKTLDADAYKELSKQSIKVAPFVFSDIEPDLFQKVLTQALPPGPGPKPGPVVDADSWLAWCGGK
ncbi:MAG: ubiquinol oxidase subunit II [Hyphomicrobiales bacterium]|nr:ubiquinol oxidase subunit II [Hyphomicrobiales bacterium]